MALPPPLSSGYQLWYYYPSVPGGIAMAAIFLILSLAHLILLIRSRRRFCIPLVIGGACTFSILVILFRLPTNVRVTVETIGYGVRVYAHYKPATTLPYAIQSLLILLAPILFAASVYMYLGRIITSVGGDRFSIIPIRWLTKTFVLGDVTCFVVQGAGGGVLSGAKSASTTRLGEHIILAGLILQIVIFLFFVVVALTFHFRMSRTRDTTRHRTGPWQRSLYGLYIVSVLITARNAVRAVEYAQGSSGFLLVHEWITFVFDGALMALVMIICCTWYFTDIEGRPWSSGNEEELVEARTHHRQMQSKGQQLV